MVNTKVDSGDLTYESVVVGEPLGPVSYHVTAEAIRRFADAVDDRSPWCTAQSPFGALIAPPTYLCGDYVRLIASHFTSQGPGWLHARQESRFSNPAMAGAKVTVTGTFTDKYIRRGRKYIVLECVCRDDQGHEIARHKSTLVAAR